jgi:hypothetical protein
MRSLEFILGLLDRSDSAFVSADDFEGENGLALRTWQRLGFLARDGERHPVPSCPHCLEGVPLLLGGWYHCGSCSSIVDPRHLLRWRFDLAAFLSWLASGLNLKGGVRRVDEQLWQLGALAHADFRADCFFRRGGAICERGRERVLAYRNALLLRPLPQSRGIEGFRGPYLSLLELLRQDRRSLAVADVQKLLRQGGTVFFDAESGAVYDGDVWLGDVALDTREYHLLKRLTAEQDRFVAYADLKDAVLRATGGRDGTDEATFCHKLKARLKGSVPQIDRLIATTNKAHGYRLRKHARR